MHLGARQGEVPVAHESLGSRQRGVAVVKGGDGQAGVAAEDESGERGWDQTFDTEGGGHDDHERFVGHGIHDGARDGLQVPFARQVAIDEVCDSCVGEEEEGRRMLVVQQEVGGCWGGDKAGCG